MVGSSLRRRRRSSCSASAAGWRSTAAPDRRSACRCCTRGPTGSTGRSTRRYVRRDPNGLPIHGLLNGWPQWEVVRDEPGALGGAVRLRRPRRAARGVPAPARDRGRGARARRRALTIATRVTADRRRAGARSRSAGTRTCTIPGVPREEWELTLPVTERLVLDDRQLPTGAVEPRRVPAAAAPRRPRASTTATRASRTARGSRVAGGDRRVEVEFVSGYPYAQVFAPRGDDLDLLRADDRADQRARVGRRAARRSRPGDPFEAVFRIRVA